MHYCTNCGQSLNEGVAFCCNCGAPVAAPTSAPVPAPAPTVSADAEDREFLDTTHRLLRWERKAWSITSKFYIIFGSIFTGFWMLFLLIGLVIATDGDAYAGAFFSVFGFIYACIFGGSFLGMGIVGRKACQKIPQYLDTVYTDFSLAYNRCGSIGMLVFTIIFGGVHAIFFIINFVRMKSNRATIERIIRNQRAQ